jgi:beta-mannanase
MNMVDAHGQQAMITWEPNISGSRPLLAVANGKYDAYIRRFAQDSKSWEKPYYLRFAHEMNGTWYPWSPGVNDNTSGDYVAAWRHVHDIFVAEGATNAKWVWSPNEEALCQGCTPIEDLYPGDSYVDLTAMDGYNWGTTDPSGWRSFTSIFASTYDKITNVVASSKPILVAETASVEQGGNKAAWITSAYGTEIPNRFPKLVAIIWFGGRENGSDGSLRDWRVNSSPAALGAFKLAIADSYYQHGHGGRRGHPRCSSSGASTASNPRPQTTIAYSAL